MRICINAGHCPNMDCGAVGSFLQEAVATKSIAKIVCDDLEAVGYETLFVQENELEDITDASNNFDADLFISIHCNAAANVLAKGTETWYYKNSTKGEYLAKCIQSQIVNSLNMVDRGVKYSTGLYVLKHTVCPSALVETGFISNKDDEEKLNNNIDVFAHAIARGITDFYC